MLRGAGRVFPGVGWGEEECEEEAHLPQAGQQPGDEEPAGDLGGPLDGEEDAVKVREGRGRAAPAETTAAAGGGRRRQLCRS